MFAKKLWVVDSVCGSGFTYNLYVLQISWDSYRIS